MKALLLAAGKASRLGELSRTTPKCLHRIGDEVLLDRVVRQLGEVGVSEFLINTHHLANQIVSHIAKRSDRESFRVTYEPDLLGTLGTLRANLDFFGGDSGWVVHADNFIDGSLSPLVEGYASRPKNIWGSLLTFRTEKPNECGIVVTDRQGVMTAFHEKVHNPPGNQANAATYVFSAQIFELVGRLPTSATDISRHLLPLLAGRLLTVTHEGVVVDIGTPRGLQNARSVAGWRTRFSGEE